MKKQNPKLIFNFQMENPEFEATIATAMEKYTEDVLLIPAPHDDIYLKWLETKIDYYNAEYVKYNNSSTAFNNAYSAFERCYNRQHMPIQHKLKFF